MSDRGGLELLMVGWWTSSIGDVTILCNLLVKAGKVDLRKLAPLLLELITSCCNVSWAVAAEGDIADSELTLGWSKPEKKYGKNAKMQNKILNK